MARKSATNWNDLKKILNQEIQKTIQNPTSSTANTAIEAGKRHIQSDVYDVYTEGFYSRTGQLKESFKIENTPEGIIIYNDRTDGSKQVAYIVHEADGYTQSFPYENTRRPFIENTAEELRSSGELSVAFITDLKKRGFNVKKM